MIRSAASILAEEIELSIHDRRSARSITDLALSRLRANDWHLVSRPTVSVVPEEGDVFGYARGLEDVRIEGQLDGLLVSSLIKIHSQLPEIAVVHAKTAASGRYSYELGRLLGLPL